MIVCYADSLIRVDDDAGYSVQYTQETLFLP